MRPTWDYPGGSREVRFGDQFVYLSDDGVWLESGRFEWSPGGPIGEWGFAQSLAVDVLEADPEVVGFEEVVGVPTVRLRVVFEEGFADLWVDASGLVMKLITEVSEEGSSLRFQTVWEVIDLDVEPDEPLPPGA